MSNEIFEIASRNQVRFNSPQGPLATEDLWGLPLRHNSPKVASLLGIATELSRAVTPSLTGVSEIEALIGGSPAASKEARLTQVKLEIVKHVIKYKVTQETAAKTRADNAVKAAQIREIIAEQQNAALKSKSTDELQTILAGMNAQAPEQEL